jgi:DNA adenine methylase
MGGKFRTGKEIAHFLESKRTHGQVYFEPFVGGAWVLQEISGDRIASDGCHPLISLYIDLQSGWIPPDFISEYEYNEFKNNGNKYDGMTGFIGFGCSFSGKYFGGYARSENRNYCLNAKNSLIKQLPKIKDVQFLYGEYDLHFPVDKLIYCDPPYENTTQYGYSKKFDHAKFWNKMREWSKYNTVIISEYNAPDDFKCALEIETKTGMRCSGIKEKRIEKLFMIKEK